MDSNYSGEEVDFFQAHLSDIDKVPYENLADRINNSKSYGLMLKSIKKTNGYYKALSYFNFVVSCIYGVLIAQIFTQKNIDLFSQEAVLPMVGLIAAYMFLIYIVWKFAEKKLDNKDLIKLTLQDNADQIKTYYKEFFDFIVKQDVLVTNFDIDLAKFGKRKMQIVITGRYIAEELSRGAIIKLRYTDDFKIILARKYLLENI